MSSPCVIPVPSLAARQRTADLLAAPDASGALPWRILTVSGPDARQFLQGQVTCDVREVTPTQARPGCLLNLKGRIECNFYLLAVDDALWLVLPADQVDPALARLRKYALFSQVTLAVGDQGVTGALASASDAAPLSVRAQADGLALSLPGQRCLCISHGPAAAIDDAFVDAWRVRAIASGDWLLPAADGGRFQPQELDQHQLQGVSYQKGCYLGQEIVARLYFRGQLKHQLTAVAADCACPSDAPELALSLGQPQGELVAAAWAGPDQLRLLMLLPEDTAPVALVADGQALTGQRQPFRR